MSDRPVGDELLDVARATVLQELLPALPRDAHYTARMVANAIAIARRERCADDPAAGIRAFVASLPSRNGGDDWQHALAVLIRAGAFDEDDAGRTRLVEALARWTRARVAISNPRLLDTPAA